MKIIDRAQRAGGDWWHRRSWGVPTIPVSNRQEKAPTILFLAPDYDIPAGGVRIMYRHVDILNEAGFPAAVFHQKPPFRCSWFPNSTRIVYATQRGIGPQDLLVVPELDVYLFASGKYPVAHVVLNQSGWLTWKRFGEAVDAHYHSVHGPRGIITVSDYSAALLREAFPTQDVRHVRPGLDIDLFRPLHEPPSERLVSFMPRRGGEDAAILWRMVGDRLQDRGWSIRPIRGLDQPDVAKMLQRSSIFVSLSGREGFGLPPAEAMACASYVVGFHGLGGREFFHPEFSHPVESSDVLGIARGIMGAVEHESEEPGWLRHHGLAAAEYVREQYSPNQEAADVLRAYPDLVP